MVSNSDILELFCYYIKLKSVAFIKCWTWYFLNTFKNTNVQYPRKSGKVNYTTEDFFHSESDYCKFQRWAIEGKIGDITISYVFHGLFC